MSKAADVPVRFGLVGYGAWGSHHARAIMESPNAELVAIVARSESSRAAAREAHRDLLVTSDLGELLARDDVDVIDVVLPSDLHFSVGTAVIEAGKHLLIEKPMALNEKQCAALIEDAERHRRLIAVGHELRFSALWAEIKRMIDKGAIGEPRYCLIELWRNPYRLGVDGWRYDIDRVGSWILEEPIHFFDLARWYFSNLGEPQRIFAVANGMRPELPELQDNFAAIVNFPRGAYAVVAQTLSAFEHHQTVKITGSAGSLWAVWSGASDRTFHPTFSLKHFDGTALHEIPVLQPAGEVFELVDEISAMAAAVRGERSALATGNDGRWSVAMCERAQQSIQAGAPIPF